MLDARLTEGLAKAARLSARAFEVEAAKVLALSELDVPAVDWDVPGFAVAEQRMASPEGPLPGFAVTVTVPVSGTTDLFRFTPRQHLIGGFVLRPTLHPSRKAIELVVNRTRVDEDRVAVEFAALRRDVERSLAFVREDLARWRPDAGARLSLAVAGRRAFLASVAELRSSLTPAMPTAQTTPDDGEDLD
ncbi:hypothetical protein C5C24_01720 [Rathayibacter sp. AY2B3]|uniref:hypothetical protein n=1 Tax=Rathayibacter sp. AY2B3 TaxID=2080569 RepID=UPI000CE811D8|nr:hypothetical protein [Rathayibacter sp. AY2B3]PPG53746.1 hypothetical protein C5C24_01720 [Rathayibacter sp. AY2B3]